MRRRGRPAFRLEAGSPDQPTAAKRRQRPEQLLQKAVAKFLNHALPADAMYFHPPMGGWRSSTEAKIFKSMGSKAGIPDIVIIWAGRVFMLELKAPGGRLTEVQIDMHARLGRCGCPVAVALSVEMVESALTFWQIPLRAHLA